MEKFLSLPCEKQERIISSGMKVFGTVGYKKASINDIAKEANISKASIFLYFNSKREFYLFLINYANDEVLKKFADNKIANFDNFFDKLQYATEIKMRVLKKMPYVMKFLTLVYFEKDEEVYNEILKIMEISNKQRDFFMFTNLDREMFKENIDPELVLKILQRWTEGYLQTIVNSQEIDLDELMQEFNLCLNLLKSNFIKPEYL